MSRSEACKVQARRFVKTTTSFVKTTTSLESG